MIACSCAAKLDCAQCMQEEHKQGNVVGLDVSTGEALDPAMAGIFDNYLVKKQILQSAPIVASQLLLVDEVMRAGEMQVLLTRGLGIVLLLATCTPAGSYQLHRNCERSTALPHRG